MKPRAAAAAFVVVTAVAGAALASVAAGRPPKSCNPSRTNLVAADRTGAVYYRVEDDLDPDDGLVFASCRAGTPSTATTRERGFGEQVQVASVDVGGRYFASAGTVCPPAESDDPCNTQIRVETFDGAFGGVGVLADPRTVDRTVQVTALRLSSSRALAWIVCRPADVDQLTPASCRTARKYLYVVSAPGSRPGKRPRLVGSGTGIRTNSLHLDAAGRTVTWVQGARLRRARV